MKSLIDCSRIAIARYANVRTALGTRSVLFLFALIAVWGPLVAFADDSPANSAKKSQHAATDKRHVEAIRRLIAQLDADTGADREEATRELAQWGAAAIPLLAEATNHPSAEVRERALALLANHAKFDEVAPYLMRAVAKAGGASPARSLLESRCLEQIDLAAENPAAARLLKFWGSNHEKYRTTTAEAFKNVKSNSDLARVVQPLVGLPHKAATFGDLVTRLANLSIASDHAYAAGYVAAATLARGLREDREEYVAFATAYVEALEKLAIELRKANTPQNKIRDEIANRAGWCQGATSYLTEMLDPTSETYQLVTKRFGISSSLLRDEFFRGLSSNDATIFSQGVGRVHIVDLLGDSLAKWPAAPREGVVEQFVTSVIHCAKAGDKPKALVYLEALDACHELSDRGVDVEQGLGKQLAERYFLAARAAPDHRSYYAARNVHVKLRIVLDCGILPDHDPFPHELIESFVAGDAGANIEQKRLALERYVSLLERLTRWEIRFQQPGAIRFTRVALDRLVRDPNQFEAFTARLDQLPREKSATSNPSDASAIDDQLRKWADEIESMP